MPVPDVEQNAVDAGPLARLIPQDRASALVSIQDAEGAVHAQVVLGACGAQDERSEDLLRPVWTVVVRLSPAS